MKKIKYLLPLIAFLALMQNSCSKEDDQNPNSTNAPVTSISAEEEVDLIYMREEEKLARDVYLYAFDLYGKMIFSNISNSEQTHMDQILTLLNTYGIEDPSTGVVGTFSNTQLQTLYDGLISLCDQSLVDALEVGATIEDLDIFDLNSAIAQSNKADIIGVYEFLSCGSRNHMRSFVQQLNAEGGSYSTQYISEAEYLAIIGSEKEKCGQ